MALSFLQMRQMTHLGNVISLLNSLALDGWFHFCTPIARHSSLVRKSEVPETLEELLHTSTLCYYTE